MMKVCQYPNCDRRACYLMGWINEKGKHFGFVCATHDKMLGRKNLTECGMSLGEAIAFERYLKKTVDLADYPEWSEWLEQYVRGNPDGTLELERLNLSPRTFNALYRHQIRTIDELEGISMEELMTFRMIGVKGLVEIQKALERHDEQN